MTPNYAIRPRKRDTQSALLCNILEPNFVSFAGTSVDDLLRTINYRKFKKVTLFELKPDLYKKAVIDTSHISNVKVKFADISKHLNKKNTYYDFDFETTITNPNVVNILSKISKLNNFSMTFCVRKITIVKTNEILKSYFPMFRYEEVGYKDGAPMRMYRLYKIN